MKRVVLLVFLLSTLGMKAQDKISFAYDAAGNRVSRVLVLDSSKARSASASQASSSFSDMVGNYAVQILPNSSTGHVVVEMIGKGDAVAVLSVYNVSGMQVYHCDMKGERMDVDLSTNPSGIYILNIEIEKEKSSWKIVKK